MLFSEELEEFLDMLTPGAYAVIEPTLPKKLSEEKIQRLRALLNAIEYDPRPHYEEHPELYDEAYFQFLHSLKPIEWNGN